MNALGLGFLLLLALTGTISAQAVAPVSTWTCANRRGYCRRFCLAHEVHIGHYGCPRRYRVLRAKDLSCGMDQAQKCQIHINSPLG
ncbi:unnamed protein product [Eretmochelys imbricata]